MFQLSAICSIITSKGQKCTCTIDETFNHRKDFISEKNLTLMWVHLFPVLALFASLWMRHNASHLKLVKWRVGRVYRIFTFLRLGWTLWFFSGLKIWSSNSSQMKFRIDGPFLYIFLIFLINKFNIFKCKKNIKIINIIK